MRGSYWGWYERDSVLSEDGKTRYRWTDDYGGSWTAVAVVRASAL